MKTRLSPRPLTKQTIGDALDRATSQLVRADHQFSIRGPRQRGHWEETRHHLLEARAATDEAIAVLEALFVEIYGPLMGGKG